ncbi:hypothetical protein EYZ11_008860 [Aspergillus tanneri]|nr:hypothetical protein EYZ11_008860 [Aspergillus tanneri]
MGAYHPARVPQTTDADTGMSHFLFTDQPINTFSQPSLNYTSHHAVETPEPFHSGHPNSAAADDYYYCVTTSQWFSSQLPPQSQQAPLSTAAPSYSPTSHDESLFPPAFPSSPSYLHQLPVSSPAQPSTARTSSTPDNDSPTTIATNQPSQQKDLSQYGIPEGDGTWRCAHEGCKSSTRFRRGCDLRKHYNRHKKTFNCRHPHCEGSKKWFSSKKDRDRHEAKHNPDVKCEWGCPRVFSRVDNMKDHVRRMHRQ